MILRILLYTLVAYVLYKLIFDFIIPVYRTGRQIRKQFNDVKQRMEGQDQFNNIKEHKTPADANNKIGEYIDFEEVKPQTSRQSGAGTKGA
jgi:hypothetical protein